MFPRRFFAGVFFAPRYFPQSAGSAPSHGGTVCGTFSCRPAVSGTFSATPTVSGTFDVEAC